MAHLQICTAKQIQCKICKKVGHYTSLCTAKTPERQPPRGPSNNQYPQYKQQQTRRVEHVKQETPESDQTEENIDAEAALNIKELHEDWANFNLIRPTDFSPMKNEKVNKDPLKEFWVETTTGPHKIQWLADTGSPRTFMNEELANKLQREIPNIKITEYTKKYNLQKLHQQQHQNKRSTLNQP